MTAHALPPVPSARRHARRCALTLVLAALAVPVAAQPWPPGLAGAALLPGWVEADGTRVTALALDLMPGWKTYWRQPGDGGIPPALDWSASPSVGAAAIGWPAPHRIDASGTLGYAGRVVLPVRLAPAAPGTAIEATPVVTADLGLCETVCVPATLTLTAPPPAADDPAIRDALAAQPGAGPADPACRLAPIRDGTQVAIALAPGADAAAVEVAGRPDLWASPAAVAGGQAVVDLVPPDGRPFPVDPATVVLTQIDAAGRATETTGCVPTG